MANGVRLFLLRLFFSAVILMDFASAQRSGFLSLDCGGRKHFYDDLDIEWTPDDHFMFGSTARISVKTQRRLQYSMLRHFPADGRKYCYDFTVSPSRRYLLRATFLYGNYNAKNVCPKFDISLGATYWSTIFISDANTVESREMIFLATEPSVSVCLYNATIGSPFISTIELRQLIESMYANELELQYYLSVSARINFAADGKAPIRYPDDPFDRIWEPDSYGNPYYLVSVAGNISRVSTQRQIDARFDEYPPQKVMQTAAVGTSGQLSYRLELTGFPGYGWVAIYFAEIEDLGPNETRKFRMAIPYPSFMERPVSIVEDTGGKYRLYEHHLVNISLPFTLFFEFSASPRSSLGPLLNALEIIKYMEINKGSPDAPVVAEIISAYPASDWAQEGGDPCLPVPWSWLRCNIEPAPRVTSIFLSRKNLTGDIPSSFTNLTRLVELWLDGNSLTGPIPAFTGSAGLEIIHLENNELTGKIPVYLVKLQNLKELYLQNNNLSGIVPSGLHRRNLILNVSGNTDLREEDRTFAIVFNSIIALIVITIAASFTYSFCCKKHHAERNEPAQVHGDEQDAPTRGMHALAGSNSQLNPSVVENCFSRKEILKATKHYEREIGSGGSGRVYYGILNDKREVAVKVLIGNSAHQKREFLNEVTILSRIHHENLVELLGFCQEEGTSLLVCEYMHNGNLEDHLSGELARVRPLTWMERLKIAEDAAKGLVYLHTVCSPAIIHRDLKSSNILLDKDFRAKVADFGLSKFAAEGSSPSASRHIRGTFGYMDPACVIGPEFTHKLDVYSFGIVLLELISGRKAVIKYGDRDWENISQWAKPLLERGEIEQVMDGAIIHECREESALHVGETALLCVESNFERRISMTEVLRRIKEAMEIQRGGVLYLGPCSSEGAGPSRIRSRSASSANSSDSNTQSSHL